MSRHLRAVDGEGGPSRLTVFLDRDGVINRKAPEGSYVTRWSDFSFLPGSLEALRLLAERQIVTIVVTNQRAVARGIVTTTALAELHRLMCEAVRASGGRIDLVVACEHDVDSCECRKPGTGLFLQARQRFPTIEFQMSVVIGDSANDIMAGASLGCRTVLVGDETRREGELRRLAAAGVEATATAPSLLSAIRKYVAPREAVAR